MAHPNQPSRVESILLALALAVAGTVFLADTMSSVPHLEVLTSHAAFQAAAVVMVTVGICLLIVEWPLKTLDRSPEFREKTHFDSSHDSWDRPR